MSFSYSINNETITETCNTKEDWNAIKNFLKNLTVLTLFYIKNSRISTS